MTSTFVLIMFLGVRSITTAQFADAESCIQAGKGAEVTAVMGSQFRYVCVPYQSPRSGQPPQ